jgi:hypothetical protein
MARRVATDNSAAARPPGDSWPVQLGRWGWNWAWHSAHAGLPGIRRAGRGGCDFGNEKGGRWAEWKEEVQESFTIFKFLLNFQNLFFQIANQFEFKSKLNFELF